MNNKQPKLRKHASGLWFCHWAGKHRYFSRNFKESQAAYRSSIKEWRRWQDEKDGDVERRRPTRSMTVWELYKLFLSNKELDSSPYTVNHLKYALRQFVAIHKQDRAAAIRPMTISTYRAQLGRETLAAKTVNHYVSAVKQMFKWAMEMELIPPLVLSGIRPLKLSPPPPKGYSVEIVRKMVGCDCKDVSAWVKLHWLTMARPLEVVRMVNRLGEFVEPWLFRPNQAKTGGRMIVFSPAALTALSQCVPRWKSLSGYSHAVVDETTHAPHPLRHGGATYLHQQGVARESIDLLLGHRPRRVSVTYVPIDYQALLASVQLLEAPLRNQSAQVS